MKIVDTNKNDYFWLVGASFNDHTVNMCDIFIKENRWENGYTDKYQDRVKEMKVGDKIVIKSSFTQKYDLPFNNHDRIVSVMRIKAIGTVTNNKNDGNNVDVQWEKIDKPRDWYGRGVYQSTISKVTVKDEVLQELKEFIFNNGAENIERLEEYYKENDQKEVTKGEEGDETEIIMKETGQDQCSAQFEKFSKNTILYGPPGTGKTYNTVAYAVAICKRITKEELENLNEFKNSSGQIDHTKIFREYEKFRKMGRIKFITFHQSYGYEEFIEGIKPKLEIDNKTELHYEIKDGSFKAFCKNANSACVCEKLEISRNADPQSKLEPYVFIIDEINRGNISKIFGELITLIEPNKRLGAKETRWATLPYSGDDFSVPSNVYILGTMNTADRSLALMDTALRRRFNFIEMIPDYEALNESITVDGQNLKLRLMLQTINNRIECLYDREHTIGHGYFIKLNMQENQSKDILKEIFKEKIIPLLQEYFYDDYSKIQLVLGDNQKDKKNRFIKSEPYVVNKLFGTGLEIDKQNQYELNKEAFGDVNSYIGVYDAKKTENQTGDNEQIPDA